MKDLKVGDLVRDKLNKEEYNYGLGIITRVGKWPAPEEDCPKYADGEMFPPGKRYNVYFTRFGRTIEFHGDYLERV